MKVSKDIKSSIFRAYDVRGQYPEELNERSVAKIAQALSRYFGSGQIVLGRDVRVGSIGLYQVIVKAFRKQKQFDVCAAGLMTTPMLYFLVNHFKARGGIMITASHNPKKYNGLKVFGSGGTQISGKEILKLIEKL